MCAKCHPSHSEVWKTLRQAFSHRESLHRPHRICPFLAGDKMQVGSLVRVTNGTVEVFRSTMRLVVDKGIGEIESVTDKDADSITVRVRVAYDRP